MRLIVSRRLSLTAVESFTNTSFGAVSEVEVEVAQSEPPEVFDAVHPVGRAGAVTPSKFSAKTGPPHGPGVGDGVGVGLTVGLGLGVGVAVGTGLGVGVGLTVGVGV